MRARGCLIATAVLLALTGAVAAVLGPRALRKARRAYAPIQRMRVEKGDFDTWMRQREWKEPPAPTLTATQLDRFLALRRDLRRLDERQDRMRSPTPGGNRTRLQDVPAIMEGMGGLMAERYAAFRRHDVTPAEYDYVERLVYGTWLPGLAGGGSDPAARERAAAEIEKASRREPAPIKARLREIAAEMRARVPPAPEGIPEQVHQLLLSRAATIGSQPAGRVSSRVPRARERRRPAGSPSPPTAAPAAP
jgi:hypothetical protein